MSDVRPNNLPARLGSWERARPWVALSARVLVGAVFVLAGFSKLILPHAEVVALMQQYQVLPAWLLPPLATVMPWLELGSGTALLIGFCTTPAALLVAVQLLGFCLLMVAVLLTGVTIEDCGCFGQLGLRETPLQVLIRDVIMLGMMGFVLWRGRDVWGVDALGAPQMVPEGESQTG